MQSNRNHAERLSGRGRSAPRIRRSARRALGPSAILLALTLLAPGCGTMHMDGTFRMEGPLVLSEGSYVSDAMFESLEEGSHKSWAIGIFGQPDQRTTLEDGSELWRWTFLQTQTDIGVNPSLLSLGDGKDEKGKTAEEAMMSSQSSKTVITNTYVHIVRDRVEAKWRG